MEGLAWQRVAGRALQAKARGSGQVREGWRLGSGQEVVSSEVRRGCWWELLALGKHVDFILRGAGLSFLTFS